MMTVPTTASSAEMGPNARTRPPAAMDHVSGEVLVKFKKGTRASEKRLIHAAEEVDVLSEIREIGVERVKTRRGESTEALLQRYKNNPRVEYAEPNVIYHSHVFPNDPRFSELWGLHNVGQSSGTLDADIDAPEAWDSQTGSGGVVVADIDSGADYTHPDLAANLWTNPGEIAGNGIDDDGNGYVDDVRGWDFLNHDNDPFDDDGHGTHTAGTIAAVGNNGVGVVGVAWQAKIMPLKFLGPSGGPSSAAASAIVYAANMGARISNNSWGCSPLGPACFSQAVENAIAYANAQGALFVVSAGNDNNNNDVTPAYPCASGQPNVICVAATDRNDQRYSSTNYGVATVHLGAPGVAILSTVPTGSCGYCSPSGYAYLQGTSMAAPHVSGAAALVLAQFPSFTVTDLKNTLLAAVDPIPALAGFTVTGGRLNAQRAVLSGFVLSAAPSAQTVTGGGSATYTVLVVSLNAFSESVALTLISPDSRLTGSFSPETVTPPANGVATSTLVVSAQAGLPTGNYAVTIRGAAASSETHSTTITVTVGTDVAETAVSPISTNVAPGDPLLASDSTQNQGGSPAGAFAIEFHLSVDAAYGGVDDIVLAPTRSVASLAAGASSGATTMLTVPATTPLGSYFLCAKADSGNAIDEGAGEGNNALCGASTITVAPSAAAAVPRLANISTRSPVQTGDNVLIGGFIIGGTTPKTVLIRSRGPSMGGAPFNISGVLANPTMQLYSGSTVIARNNDWQTTDALCGSPAAACGGAAQITATAMDPCQPNPGQTAAPPNCALESALLVTLPPGGYTAMISGVGGGTGVGLVEVFEADTSATSTLINISSRARVLTGDNVMIGGVIIGGPTPKTVLIRARGPSMGGAPFNVPGVLANPTMRLYSGSTVIAQNDNWQTTDPLCGSPATTCGTAAQVTATAMDPCQPNPGQSVAPPNCAQEAALLITLPPGGYTTIVSGVGGGTGVGLVEVFEAP